MLAAIASNLHFGVRQAASSPHKRPPRAAER